MPQLGLLPTLALHQAVVDPTLDKSGVFDKNTPPVGLELVLS
jgi:hypothetical protein